MAYYRVTENNQVGPHLPGQVIEITDDHEKAGYRAQRLLDLGAVEKVDKGDKAALERATPITEASPFGSPVGALPSATPPTATDIAEPHPGPAAPGIDSHDAEQVAAAKAAVAGDAAANEVRADAVTNTDSAAQKASDRAEARAQKAEAKALTPEAQAKVADKVS